MRPCIACVRVVILWALGTSIGQGALVEGRVYVDANQNARWDEGESGVAGVLVSDGVRVTTTDAKGCYRLDTSESRALVWITLPRDHRPAATFWRWCDGRQVEDFGLVRSPQPADFCFVQITDTHIGRDDLLRQFAEGLAARPASVAFVVNTGDLVMDATPVDAPKARQLYDRYLGAAAAFRQPLFNVPGNHEHVAVMAKDADKNDPLYGKGLYRQLVGPMHYSWDWGEVHFVALDGTTLPQKEELGAEQLAWLKADLAFQPNDKPLVLFCHQSAAALKDVKDLTGLLQDRKVLGIFCGHLHKTLTTQLGSVPVYITGALSGSWWSGPNPDGTPQGFRLVQIKAGRLKTVYAGREGRYPLCVVSPRSITSQSGKISVEVLSLDFGKPVEVTARYADQPTPLALASREELWSTWTGTVDTSLAPDGDRVVQITSRLGDETGVCTMRYLVLNGRQEPYQATADAVLKLDVRGVRAPGELLLDGKPLGTIPADTPQGSVLSFEIPKDRLAKVNRVTIRSNGKPGFSAGPVWLEYQRKKIYDLRYVSFERHRIVATPDHPKPERDLYFCLP